MSGIETLVVALRQTFSSNPAEVHAAEKFFQASRGMPQFLTALLQVLSSAEIDQYTKQAAAIQFKNASHLFWDSAPNPDGTPTCISESEKAFVRSNILEAISVSHPLIRKQLALALKRITLLEYPEKWPELVPKLISFMAAQNPQALTGALVALRATARNYEFTAERDESRPALVKLVEQIFPTLEQMVQHLVKAEPTVETLNIERLLIKILWSCTNMGFTPYMSNPGVLATWLGFIRAIVERTVNVSVPENSQAGGAEHPWWRTAKRASEICTRWLMRYGSPREVKKDLRQTVVPFQQEFAPAIGIVFLNLLANHSKGQFYSKNMLHSAMSYLSTGVRMATVYKALQPHVQGAFTQVIFPLMCYTAEDESTFMNDPIEYIRREFDPLDNFYSLRLSAMNLTVDFCKFRGKNHLIPFMTHVAQVLQFSSTDKSKAPLKFGAMVVVTALDGKLKKTQPFAGQLEVMIKNCVLPELQSPVPIVRAIATWCFARFADIEFQDKTIFATGLQSIVALTRDSQLAVSLYAALALKYPVQTEQGRAMLLPILPQVLETYFNLLDHVDVDADDLVLTLEVFAQVFGADIAPHAFNICKRLVDSFVNGAYAESDEDEGQVLKAVGCLEAIETILATIQPLPELFHQLGVALIPMMALVLGRNQDQTLDYLPNVLSILTILTYHNPPLRPQYWTVFPLLYQAFDDYATEFLSDMLDPLDNFISRGKETFLGNPVYLDLVYRMCEKLIGDPNTDEIDCLKACQLAEVVMHHCVGLVDQFVTKILTLVHKRLQVAKSTVFRVLMVETFANALYYNPSLALQVSESLGATQGFFTAWFSLKDKFARVYDKKIAVLGLTSLLRLPMASLPAVVQGSMTQLIKQVMAYIKEMQKQERVLAKEMKALEEAGVGDDDDEEEEEEEDQELDEEGEVEIDDDDDGQAEDDDDEDEDEWDDAIQLGDDEDSGNGKITFDGLVDKCATFRTAALNGGLADEDGADFAELEEDCEVDTPINNVNEVLFFVDAVNAASQDAQYQSLFASLGEKEKALAQKLAGMAPEIRAKMLKKSEEAAKKQ